MRIAIPCEKEKIALQFGNTSNYRFYQVEHHLLERSYSLASGVDSLEDTAKFLKLAGVQLVICGGIGGAAVKALDSQGILIMGGILGNADQRIEEFLAGELEFHPLDPRAHQHGHEGCSCHHEEGHNCSMNCEDCSDDGSSCGGSTDARN